MKCLMPLNQRLEIAKAIEGRQYVEWGCGGTTVWLSKHSRPLHAISIEHDQRWLEKLQKELPGDWFACCIGCEAGQNATPGEEASDNADYYIDAGANLAADVYLIDGVVRGRCLRALVDTGRPMTVFIHDTQRDWYDDAIQYAVDNGFRRTDYPEGEDYPGCLLTKLEKYHK